MPKLVSCNERYDFGLSNQEFNKRIARRLLDEDFELIAENSSYRLAFAEKSQVVYLFCFERNRLEFYCSIFLIQSKLLGTCARQDALWKRRGTLMPDVARANFRWLLHRHDTIVSSSVHTVDGKRFWKVRLHECAEMGLTIGLWGEGSIIYRDPVLSVEEWLEIAQPWGSDPINESRLIFVSRMPPTEVLTEAPREVAAGKEVLLNEADQLLPQTRRTDIKISQGL